MGYKGCVLVPKLLAAGHEVKVFDIGWFGCNLPKHEALEVRFGDVRDGVPWLEWAETVIHLAAIANDPCGDLDARLTWDVNALATYRLGQDMAKCDNAPSLIFASSASVYGIKGNKPVTEDDDFAPVSDYNKTKMVAERLLSTLSRDLFVQVVRPATICGVSPRQRLDVIVNLLAAQALERGEITAHTGKHGATLMRPHMHIDDVADLYLWLLQKDPMIYTGPYNAASENQTVGETAEIVRQEIGAKVTLTETADKRSYAVDFSRLTEAGFKPKKTVRDAVRELAAAWRAGTIRRGPMSINLEWMKANGWARG